MTSLTRRPFVASSATLALGVQPVAEQRANDPILSGLPFVQDGRAYGLPSGTWTNPGVVGVPVTRVVDALTGEATE